MLYYTNGSHKVFAKVLCGWSVRRSRSYHYEKNKERQEFKLGDAQGTPSKYSMILKRLSLGMPRKASHLSSSTIIGMSRFLFSSHDMRKFLERLLCLFLLFLLCTMLVWDSPWLIYRMLIALHLNLLSMALYNASCASLISFEVWIACFSSHRKPPFVECSFASLIFVRAWAYIL